MREQISSWLAPSAPDPELARRQYLLNLVLLGLAGPGFLFGLVMAVMWALGRAPITGVLAGFAVQPFYLLAYWLGRRGRVRLAGYIPVMAVFLVMVGGSCQIGIGHVTLIGYAMVTLTAGILIGNGAALLFALFSTVAYVIVGMAQTAGRLPGALPPEATVFADAAGLGLGLVVLVIFSWLSAREMSRALHHERELGAELQTQHTTLEQQVAERTQELARRAMQLETAAEVAREATTIRDVDELLDETARLISDRFGFYHAGVFLVDDAREYAVLQAASSEGGRRMLERGHKLAVGEVGIVGYVTGTGKPRIALDVGKDAVFFDNPDLPATRSEMALPLRVRGEVIGALDVQSTEPGAFSDDDVAALQTVADQLAVAIENARLFEQTQASLREVEALYGDYSKEAWGALTRAGRVHGYTYDRVSVSPVAADRPAEVQQALREGHVVAVGGGDGRDEATLAIPISVRGKVIGVLDICKSGEAGGWTPEEMALVERVSDQLGLALESARLYQDTQRRAAREQLTGEVTARMRETLDVETVLQTAVREMRERLNLAEAEVRMGTPAPVKM
jgi:GAF domain-containing protein